jgi:hypothetical protein
MAETRQTTIAEDEELLGRIFMEVGVTQGKGDRRCAGDLLNPAVGA